MVTQRGESHCQLWYKGELEDWDSDLGDVIFSQIGATKEKWLEIEVDNANYKELHGAQSIAVGDSNATQIIFAGKGQGILGIEVLDAVAGLQKALLNKA